jgi:hypothetical protein
LIHLQILTEDMVKQYKQKFWLLLQLFFLSNNHQSTQPSAHHTVPFCNVTGCLLCGHLRIIHFILEPVIVHISLLGSALNRCDLGLARYGMVYAKQEITYQITVFTVVYAGLLHMHTAHTVTTTEKCYFGQQFETSPEILLIYRAHLTMTAHKISAADMLCKGVKKLLKFVMYSSNSCHHACVWWQRT